MDNQRKEVIENDNDIIDQYKRQMSGATTEKEKQSKPSQNQNEELFFRSIGYRQ